SPIATGQATFYLTHMPSNTVDALEIGNEPDSYRNVLRCEKYNFTGEDQNFKTVCDAATGPDSDSTNITYLSDFQTWRSSIDNALSTSSLPAVKFMGPSFGTLEPLENNTFWSAAAVNGGYLQAFENQEGSTNTCGTPIGSNSMGIV